MHCFWFIVVVASSVLVVDAQYSPFGDYSLLTNNLPRPFKPVLGVKPFGCQRHTEQGLINLSQPCTCGLPNLFKPLPKPIFRFPSIPPSPCLQKIQAFLNSCNPTCQLQQQKALLPTPLQAPLPPPLQPLPLATTLERLQNAYAAAPPLATPGLQRLAPPCSLTPQQYVYENYV